jgi:phage major head subunit gpT-like protein
MNRATFSKAVVPGLFAFMNSALARRPKYYDKITKIKTSKKAYEESAYFAGVGLFPEKPEGEQISYDSFIQGPTKRWVPKTYGLGLRLTEELIEDSLYPEVPSEMGDMSKELGNSAAETMELIVHDVFNNGTVTTNHTAGDGLAVFSTVHKLLNGSTWSNRSSADGALSAATLRQGFLDFENTLSDRGIQQVQRPKILLVPPALEYTAMELVKSTYTPEDNNNSINALQSRNLEIVMDPYLTSSTAWFLLGEDNPIITFMRRAPKFAQDGDFETGDAKFKGTFRMSVEVNKPIGIYMNVGA